MLKDLVPTTQALTSELLPVTTEAKSDYGPATTMTSLSRHSGGSVAIAKPQGTVFAGNMFPSDPFEETDPFDNTDPFSDSFKDDPFTSMQEFAKTSILKTEDKLRILEKIVQEKESAAEISKNVFNGPLQVSLPPEPAPKSPRLQRQGTDTSTIRQRPQPSSKMISENASPPPPLPPKKTGDIIAVRPPPRPPHDHEEPLDLGPPLPRPLRKKEPLADRTTKPRLSSVTTNSSEDEYLTPAPPPLPTARRFDITLSQLLTCTMEELADRLRVPATTLSSMTLPQLTEYLRSYLAADTERTHIHVDPSMRLEKSKPPTLLTSTPPVPPAPSIPSVPSFPPAPSIPSAPSAQALLASDFKPQFEDNFAPHEPSDTFVANFDDFDKKANPSYDRYAAFREIQEQVFPYELKAKSILEPTDTETEQKQDSDEKDELTAIDLMRTNNERESDMELSRSPLKSLDELTLDSFNMFRSSVSPKPSQIDAKIEDIKSVMKNLQIEKSRSSVSPRDNGFVETKQEDANDRYAALREITITEPPDEFESIPPEVPKERKKSDEKSDGFDNSDFFDCIDNSSLSFTHVEDAFRKSPMIKERDEKKVEEKKEIVVEPVTELQPPPERLSTGSISDVVSGSSPDTKEKCGRVVGVGVGVGVVGVGAGRWAMLGGAGGSNCSSDSRDSEPRPRHRRPRHHSPTTNSRNIVQTSSSSRDVSPWDEDLPPARLQRPPSHHRDRESRHNSSGSRECLDSGSGREKDKLRDKRDLRDRDLSRDSIRDRRDSGSGRDRRDVSKERDLRDHRDSKDRRDRRSRERENDSWDRDRAYRERDYRDSRSRERPPKEYREKDRDRHRKTRHSYDEEDYSDGCVSGGSSPRDRWSDQRWKREERNYGSLGWRETRRRAEMRLSEDPNDRRYGSTLGWPGRRTGSARRGMDRDRDRDRDRERDTSREARRRRREEPRPRKEYRFSNDFSPREREHASPFDNDFHEPSANNVKKRTPYSNLEGSRFAFEPDEATASPLSGSSARARDGDSPATRFRFDSDSVSPRSMFEDDFTTISTPRGRTASIAEEDEGDVPPLRSKPQPQISHRDIKKSESVNIFIRESDPFEGDAFFACTGSDRVARRENWPGDFQGFDSNA